jgi:tetratricopeptide (TPR) repeat protein
MTTETVSDRISRCRERVDREPASAAAHYNLGLAYTARGLVARAEHEYREALNLDPDLVEAWVNLGGTRLLMWDFAGAAEANREALRRRDDLVEAHYNLGQAHLYLGEAKSVVDCCRRVIELDRNHAAGHYFLAVGLLATGQVSEARAAVAHAMALGYRSTPEFLRRLEQAEASIIGIHTQSPGAQASEPSKED